MFKIFVGNLDYKVRVEQLRELFSVFAPIEDLVIPVDPKTNRSKGFGIVMIRDAELGRAAVKAMQGKRLMGRTLVINEAVKLAHEFGAQDGHRYINAVLDQLAPALRPAA